MDFLVINNSILNLDKIVYIIQNEANEVRVYFHGHDHPLLFKDAEAAELWRYFDKDWKSEP